MLPPHAFRRILEALPPHEGAWEEFTIELNPEDITDPGYIKELIALGANRFSMGVQSLSDRVLKWMNRRHNAKRALEAFRTLREAGAGNISLDVIFGVGDEFDSELSGTLDSIIELRPEHISAYQLSIEEGSALARMLEEGRYVPACDEDCERQYRMICERLGEAGYEHYEISNWALPGYRAKHNSAYWSRAPYVGLGPGAHSLTIGEGIQKRSWNSQKPSEWTSEGESLSDEQIREESIMLALRTSDGVDENLLDNNKKEEMLANGMLCRCSEGKVRIPEEHFFISDRIISEFFI